MKTTVESILDRIKIAAEDLQSHSYTEFQKLLPSYIKSSLGYTLLDNFFEHETGITIKDYFNQVKAVKANELFSFYRLSPVEVAYQLGYRTFASLQKSISIRKRYIRSRIRSFQRLHGNYQVPEYLS